MPKSPKKTEAKAFVVSLKLADQEYKSDGATVIEALDGINPAVLKTRGEFTVSHDGLSSRVTMYPAVIRKLLVNRTMREIFQKRMVTTLH